MKPDDFLTEMRLNERYGKLMTEAVSLKEEYERASIPLPRALGMFFGIGLLNGKPQGHPVGTGIPPLRLPEPPEGAGRDWVAIPIEEAVVTTLVLGVLRDAGGEIKPQPLHQAVAKFAPETVYGSITNIGTRLKEQGVIERGKKDGWKLLKPEMAPIIHEGFAWGPVKLFQKQDLAAHRRMVLVHILKESPDGLMIVQITRTIEASGLCKAPTTKDLVKVDIQVLLDQGKIKRMGNTKKYTVAKNEE
jgi:hypothetical protein